MDFFGEIFKEEGEASTLTASSFPTTSAPTTPTVPVEIIEVPDLQIALDFDVNPALLSVDKWAALPGKVGEFFNHQEASLDNPFFGESLDDSFFRDDWDFISKVDEVIDVSPPDLPLGSHEDIWVNLAHYIVLGGLAILLFGSWMVLICLIKSHRRNSKHQWTLSMVQLETNRRNAEVASSLAAAIAMQHQHPACYEKATQVDFSSDLDTEADFGWPDPPEGILNENYSAGFIV